MQTFDRDFVEPPWRAPLDLAACLRTIPDEAQVTGMFLEPLAEAARAAGKPLPSARDRYVPFRSYPLKEHVQLMIEACPRVYPDRSARQALRAFGRGAPAALISSTLGKVMLGSTVGPDEALRAMVKAYELNIKLSKVEVIDARPGRMIIHLENVPYFLDCHHVGALEGTLRFARANAPRVTVRMLRADAADMCCAWD